MRKLTSLDLLCVLGFMLSITTAVNAATITAVELFTVYNHGTAPGCESGSFCEAAMLAESSINSIVTVTPNNDEAGGENQNRVSEKFVFADPISFIVRFRATNSGGVTEYLFEDLVVNEGDFTGLPILIHRVTLKADQALSTDQLDFDFPDQDPAPTTTAPQATIVHTAGEIDWHLYIARFQSRTMTYSLDLPDCGASSGIICNLDSESYSFTMRHIKNHPVPIPAAVWLFGSGIIGLTGFSSHKTCKGIIAILG